MRVATVVGRTRARHLGPERRRPQVLDAALAIAIERGVAAVTIGAVADRLRVTRPVVYSCFTDRVELLRALRDREQDVVITGALGALPRNRADADESVFVQGFQALLEEVARRPDAWRLVMSADPDPAVAEDFRKGRFMLTEQFARLLRPTLKAWGTTDAERKLPVLVEQFASVCEGAIRTLLDNDQDWTPAGLGELIGAGVYRAFRSA
ncbi:MAG TPA: TetR/AcrR family transcriptional regulator [Mycobacterium sp.]